VGDAVHVRRGRDARVHGRALMRPSLCALALMAGCAAKPGVCDLNSDCPHGYYCESTQCKRDCIVSNIDCPTGFFCDAIGKCEAGNGDGGVTDDLAGADFSGADLSSGLDANPALEQELDLCATDGDCASPLVCRAMYKSGASRCTRLCTSTANCLSGERCLTDALSTQTCIGEDTGRTCTMANDCNYACLTNQQYCTAPCSGGADCPNGWGCMTVASQNVCVKLEAACTA